MSSKVPNQTVLSHVVDVHCHPTDALDISPQSMDKLDITICAMSTMNTDQQFVRDLATTYPEKVIPCFGFHPWFSHTISTNPDLPKEQHYQQILLNSRSSRTETDLKTLLPFLPDPLPLNKVLNDLRDNLQAFPNAMLGEVGLDRIFRVPFDYYATPRKLTSFSISLEHQLAVLEAQLNIAIELRRNVSIHSVKAPKATLDLFQKMQEKHGANWQTISIDMHSCGLSPQTWKDIESKYNNIYLSLSTVVNGKGANCRELIRTSSNNRILVESDYNDVDMCTPRTWDMLTLVAEIKEWSLEDIWDDKLEEKDWGAVHKLEANWLTFKNGGHSVVRSMRKKKHSTGR